MKKSIKEWMDEKHISKERLAADADVSIMTVYRWLKAPEKISFEKGQSIAKTLGVDLWDIIFLPQKTTKHQ